MPPEDGGPAFPRPCEDGGANGMTLRDWFAGQAMLGALSNSAEFFKTMRQFVEAGGGDAPDWAGMIKKASNELPVQSATFCYAMADAMLKERADGDADSSQEYGQKWRRADE